MRLACNSINSKHTTKNDNYIRYTTIFTLDLPAFYYVARHETQRERLEVKHASEIFPEALNQLLEIGEKARKQREQRERAEHVARPRGARACMHAMHEEKQLKLQLQLK